MPKLKVGEEVPDFSLPADTGSDISLKDLRGRRVVVFFRAHEQSGGNNASVQAGPHPPSLSVDGVPAGDVRSLGPSLRCAGRRGVWFGGGRRNQLLEGDHRHAGHQLPVGHARQPGGGTCCRGLGQSDPDRT